MAGKATRFLTLPGGRTKRWRNKQHQCSCFAEKHFDPGQHPDEIRSRIELKEIPFTDFAQEEEEPEPDDELDSAEFPDLVSMYSVLSDREFEYQARRNQKIGFPVRRSGSLVAFCAA